MTSDMGRRLDQLDRLWQRRSPARPATDLPALYAKLVALGLARWSDSKQYWEPTDRGDLRRIKALLAERRAMTGGDRR